MAQKFFFIVLHAIPFPSSEYGGLWNIIAENNDECFDVVVKWDEETWTEYYAKLRENVIKAPRFALVEDEESRVVESFTT